MMANKRIDVDAEIDRIRLKEQAGNPATPSTGYGWLFEKSDGDLYFMNDAGEVQGPLGQRYFTLTVAGTLTVDPGLLRLYNLTGKDLTISKVHLAVNTAPTGAAIIVDVNENGTTIFTTQGNRPQIAVSAFTGESTTIDDASWADGNYLQADVDQIGSTIAGDDLTITIIAS
jgi:hypothetical protein